MMQEAKTKRWRGLLADERKSTRRAIIAVLCVSVVAMAAGPLGFWPAFDTHVLILIAPIALTALLLGKWQGCAIGALTGLAEMVHATFQPYDYYEKYFSLPLNSIVLLALFGLLMGALFALACRTPREQDPTDGEAPPNNMARFGAFVAASAIGSLFVSAFLLGGISLANSMAVLDIPANLAVHATNMLGILEQVCLGMLIIAVPCLIIDAVVGRWVLAAHKLGVRAMFQIWFGILTVVFFLVASGIAYTAVTYMSLVNMNTALSDHLNSMATEVLGRDTIVNTLDERGVLPRDELRGFSAQAYRNIKCDLPGWSQETIILAMDDVVFSSTNEELIGASLPDLITEGLGSMSYNDALASTGAVEYYQGSGYQISYLDGVEINYERLLVFAVMLGAIFLLVMRLLKRVVISAVDSANEALESITAGELDQRVPDSDSFEFSSLSAGINTTVGALENSIAEANARIDRELATARAIQESALPSAQPPFPDISVFDLYATMNPAREVGGDFYDFFKLSRGRIGFVVADVSGKGIPAALFMMSAKTAIRGAMEAKADLAKAIDIANRSLCEGNDSEMFVTAFAGVFEYETGKLTFVNAGHNKPLVMHDGKWSWLVERSGPYLGSFDWVEYKKFETQLQPGDELFAYTDGVNEAFNTDEEIYGNARLEEFLASHADLHPRRLLRAMRAELIGWANGADQSDDVTMLALKFGIPPERGASLVTEADLDNFGQVEGFIRHQLGETGCPEKVENQVLIAVEELVVNVCSYAYQDAPPDEPQPLRIHFTSSNHPNAIVIEIADDGKPFDPLERDDPKQPKDIMEAEIGGLGLHMTRKLMDEMEYVREGKANVTIITKRWD